MKTQQVDTAKLQKLSADRLITKMEKGAANEEEKKAIIQILKKRGRDVTPYEDKSLEEIQAEAKLDAEQLAAQNGVSEKSKAPKKEKAAKSSGSGKKKEIYIDDKTFPKGSTVKILNESKKVPAGTTGQVMKVGHYEGKTELFAYISVEIGGKKSTCSRMVKFIEPVEAVESEKES